MRGYRNLCDSEFETKENENCTKHKIELQHLQNITEQVNEWQAWKQHLNLNFIDFEKAVDSFHSENGKIVCEDSECAVEEYQGEIFLQVV